MIAAKIQVGDTVWFTGQSLPSLQGAVVNQTCRVVVPGLGLLAIAKVKVRYDMCTDDLNVYLTDGWRILAICPQPDQRRPDYVLGRPEADT